MGVCTEQLMEQLLEITDHMQTQRRCKEHFVKLVSLTRSSVFSECSVCTVLSRSASMCQGHVLLCLVAAVCQAAAQ